jgi:hypothetical protein
VSLRQSGGFALLVAVTGSEGVSENGPNLEPRGHTPTNDGYGLGRLSAFGMAKAYTLLLPIPGGMLRYPEPQ